MLEFNNRRDLDKHKRNFINATTILVAGVSTTLVALLLPEMVVGDNICLRAIFGFLSTAPAIVLVYLVTKLLQSLPAGFTSAFVGTWALLAWCVYDVLS